ncbi:hypothetical protein NND68_12595, partial [Enterococcus faecium]|nr:hypothetical protein [Enterococcus faecium]
IIIIPQVISINEFVIPNFGKIKFKAAIIYGCKQNNNVLILRRCTVIFINVLSLGSVILIQLPVLMEWKILTNY